MAALAVVFLGVLLRFLSMESRNWGGRLVPRITDSWAVRCDLSVPPGVRASRARVRPRLVADLLLVALCVDATCIIFQVFAASMAVLCCCYLVAFAGVPLVLMVTPPADRKAVETAFTDAGVLDEDELESRLRDGGKYQSWHAKEAAARGVPVSSGVSPKRARSGSAAFSPSGLRRR